MVLLGVSARDLTATHGGRWPDAHEAVWGHGRRSGMIVYSTMLSAEQISDGTNLNLGLSVHDAATVSTSLQQSPTESGLMVWILLTVHMQILWNAPFGCHFPVLLSTS